MNHNHAQNNSCSHGCCDGDNTTCSVHGCCGENDTVAVMDATSYTCSMHPNIRQNKPGKCPECGMDLVPVK
jgi:Cu(I)/Ag(I) efflux system membrane fusion protein